MNQIDAAQFNALEFANGLAVLYRIQELLEVDREAKEGIRDRALPEHARKQAIRDLRHVNQQFNVVATARAVMGISA
tara:strand:+ start:1012 stop:1242 length:231 start_codon:yes stop_codon:yes gene_type:complete